jgi:hypothetical protein
METNQAITRAEDHTEIDALQDAVRVLVTDDEAFLDTIGNPNVIAMSKSNQSDYFARTISGPQGDLRSLSAGSNIEAGRIHPAGILDQEYIRQIWLNSFAISMPKPSTS